MSRRRPALGLLAVLIALVGCTTTTNAPSTARPEESKETATLHARAVYERATTYLREGQPGAAVSALQEATRLDPTIALYANTMGVVLLQLRQIAAALAWLERAVQLDPSYGDAQLNYAIALSEGAFWERAIEGYRKALSLPTLTAPHVAHQNLGLALYHLKRYREAEESLRFALSLEPQMEAAHYNLGLVLIAEDRKDDARASFRRAVELAPESAFGRAAADRLSSLGDGGG